MCACTGRRRLPRQQLTSSPLQALLTMAFAASTAHAPHPVASRTAQHGSAAPSSRHAPHAARALRAPARCVTRGAPRRCVAAAAGRGEEAALTRRAAVVLPAAGVLLAACSPALATPVTEAEFTIDAPAGARAARDTARPALGSCLTATAPLACCRLRAAWRTCLMRCLADACVVPHQAGSALRALRRAPCRRAAWLCSTRRTTWRRT